jgi:hypothetical protein
MKRFISALACLGLATAGVIYLASCAAQKGPLSPNTSLVSPASVSTGLPQVASITPAMGGAAISVSQTVRVKFNLPMNPATLNTGTVLMYTMSTDGLSETQYTAYTVSYDAALRTMSIAPSATYWADNTRYRVVLTTGIQSITGAPLDGNQNGRAEDAAFDNFMASFITGAPTAPIYINIVSLVNGGGPQTPLQVLSITANYYTVGAGGTTSAAVGVSMANNLAGIAAALPVTITATFDHQLDPATAWASTTALAPAFVFTDMNGTPVAPTSVTLTAGNTAIQAVFMGGLTASTKYKMSIKGGLTGLRSTNEPWQRLVRYCYFDGNGQNKIPNNIAEASDDTLPLYLTTNGGSFSTVVTTPPTIAAVADVTYDSSANRRWVIVFTSPSGNTKMDPTTLNAANIQLLANNSVGSGTDFSLGQVTSVVTPKDIVYDVAAPGTANKSTLYVYMPDKFWSTQKNGAGGYLNFKILISHNVRSADGLYFDGNGDGISSQDFNDDYFSGNGAKNNSYRIYTIP